MPLLLLLMLICWRMVFVAGCWCPRSRQKSNCPCYPQRRRNHQF